MSAAALQVCLLLLAAASALAQLGPVYELNPNPPVPALNDADQAAIYRNKFNNFSDVEYYEWEGYDGWFNNPAHPEWGGAGKEMQQSQSAKYAKNKKQTAFLPRMPLAIALSPVLLRI